MLIRKLVTTLGMVLSMNISHGADPLPDMGIKETSPKAQPASSYTGFNQLLEDDKTLVLEELMDLDEKVVRIALYHNGDRLHRLISKQVHQMIENKLMRRLITSGRFEVIQCIECRVTKVHMTGDQLKISQAAENNQELRALSKKVRADAFMFWNASVHNDKFTINLRLVDGNNNELLWLKEYSKKTSKDADTKGFDHVDYEFIVGAWGVSGSRKNIASSNQEELDGVTVIGLRRRESTSINEEIEYTLGFEYFRNYSQTKEFDISGYNLEGRIIAGIPSFSDILDTRAYMGVGQAFYNNSNSLIFRFGLEFPFFSDGFMDFGVVMMPESDVEWKTNSQYENTGKFGGTSYDLTLGVRF